MRIKVIKTEKEYTDALNELETLMGNAPEQGTEEYEKMEVLATLIETYEKKVFADSLPDPIEAIKYRMEQLDLKQKDLIPFIGSKSKVSEILSKKRPLTIRMMQTLQDELGIPAKILLNQKREKAAVRDERFANLPIKEMVERGYLSEKVKGSIAMLEKEMAALFAPLDMAKAYALLSKTNYVRTERPVNKDALLAWMAIVVKKSEDINNLGVFEKNTITENLLRELADLSDEEDGVEKAIEKLKEMGIAVVIEPHLPQTYIDGAAIMLPNKNPIIGLTLRYDRVDNFWFTLIHETAHISKHYDKGVNIFYDDLDILDRDNPLEKEADDLALEAIVPEREWLKSPARILPARDSLFELAEKLSIHPALVAGKMRYENKNFTRFNDLLGKGEIKKVLENTV